MATLVPLYRIIVLLLLQNPSGLRKAITPQPQAAAQLEAPAPAAPHLAALDASPVRPPASSMENPL